MIQSIYKVVLFDLDGTLSKSDPGIFNGVRFALNKLGRSEPEAAVLRRMIGPPLRYGFEHVCGLPAPQAEEAVDLFRSYYNERGVFENELYPHMLELLQKLKDAGATLCVASSKAQNAAETVVDYFKVRPFFSMISASDDHIKDCSKASLIQHALDFCKVSPKETVMLGDTHFDAEGAQQAGTHFIGVLHGYGTEEEMRACGAIHFAADTLALEKLLLREAD